MAIRSIGVLAALALPLVVPLGQAQNLLQNGDFDTDLQHWSVPAGQPAGLVSWDATAGASGSGAARLTCPIVGPSIVRLQQCVEAQAGMAFDVRLDFYVESTPASGRVLVHYYDGAKCTGTLIQGYGGGPDEQATTRMWRRTYAPLGARSARVVLMAESAFNAPQVSNVFDGVSLESAVRGDLDGDGATDLVLRNSVTGAYELWRMLGTLRLERLPLVPQPDATLALRTMDDLSRDRRADLVFQDVATGEISIWRMNGAARLGAPIVLSQQPASADWEVSTSIPGLATRLVLRNTATRALQTWSVAKNGQVTVGQPIKPSLAPGGNVTLVSAAELYSGVIPAPFEPDLLWYEENTGKALLWALDEDLTRLGSPSYTNPASQGDGWHPVAVADFGVGPDGTVGTSDILWQHTNGKLVLWYLDAAGNRTLSAPVSSAGGWEVLGPR